MNNQDVSTESGKLKPAVPSESLIVALRGHQFPGGHYTIEHWENFLLTECTGAELLPNGMAHPVALFHVAIHGCGTTIAELFALGHAESDLSILIESYDWEIFVPLMEETSYRVCGSIIAAERLQNAEGKLYDRIQFRFELTDDDVPSARVTMTWHYTRDTL